MFHVKHGARWLATMDELTEFARRRTRDADVRLTERAARLQTLAAEALQNGAHRELQAPDLRQAVESFLSEIADGALERLLELERIPADARVGDISPVSVILPGTVGSVAVEEALLSLLTGGPCVLFASRRNMAEVAQIYSWLARVFPESSQNLALGIPDLREAWARDGEGALRIYGSDESVALVQSWAGPGRLVQAFGTEFSAAIVAEMGSEALEGACSALAQDVTTWGFQGCFSPVVVCVLRGLGTEEVARHVHESIARRSGLRAAPPARAVARATFAGATVMSEGPVGIAVHPGSAALHFDDGLLHFFGTDDLDSARVELRSMRDMWSTIGVSANVAEDDRYKLSLLARRVVDLGAMQRPSLVRLHDGQARIRVLLERV